MKKYLEDLKGNPLFDGIEEKEILLLLEYLGARKTVCEKGELLLRAGEMAGRAGILTEGQACVVQEDFWGNRSIVAKIYPGQIFGEVFALLPEMLLPVSVEAETRTAVLFLDLQKVFPETGPGNQIPESFYRNLLLALAEKNLRLNEKLNHMSKRTTREKLLSYLTEESRRRGSTDFQIPYNRQQLADYLSVDRSAMCSELGKLKREGFLLYRKDHFTILEKGSREKT